MLHTANYINVKYNPSLKVSYPGDIGTQPDSVAFSPNGLLVATADFANSHILVYNIATGLIQTLNSGNGPFNAIWSPDGNFIYSADTTDSTISKIAYPAGTRTPFAVPSAANGLAITRDGSTLFAACSTSANVARINTSTGTSILIPTAAGSGTLAISCDDKFVVCPNFNANSVTRIRVADNTTTTVALLNNPIWVAFSPNCIDCWVLTQNNNSINLYNVNTMAAPTVIDMNPIFNSAVPQGSVVSPDGSMVYVTSANVDFTIGQIVMIDSRTHALRTIGATLAGWIAISPNGQLVSLPDFATGNTALFSAYSTPA